MSSGAKNLMCVAPADLETIWPAVSHLIDRAYEVMDLPTPDVLPWLVEQKGLLWVLVDGALLRAACTTSLVKGRREGLVCRLVACGGEGVDWRACMAVIERYAKVEGCYKIRLDGRFGWHRVLDGFTPLYASIEKRI